MTGKRSLVVCHEEMFHSFPLALKQCGTDIQTTDLKRTKRVRTRLTKATLSCKHSWEKKPVK